MYSECLAQKRKPFEAIENKLDTGLDKALNAIISWVKSYLSTEQRKTDFKPETDVDTMASPACQQVVQQLIPLIKQIQKYMDGENLKGVMNEFGVRLHRTIFEHLQQFQYNTAGKLFGPSIDDVVLVVDGMFIIKSKWFFFLFFSFCRGHVCNL